MNYSSEKFLDCFENECGEAFRDEILDGLRKSVAFMRVKTYKAGPVLEAEVFPYWNSPKQAERARRHRPTSAAQSKINRINNRKKIARYINANFSEADYWGTFSYDDEHLPSDIEKAAGDIAKYIKRLRYHYKKRGLKFEYLYVTEHKRDEKGSIRAHHHIILSGGVSRDLIEKLWNLGGRRQVRRLQPDKMGFTGLANYFSKGVKGEMKWNHSHGLKLPEPVISDTKFKRRQIERILRDFESSKAMFESAYPGYELNSLEVRYSEAVAGVYAYAAMSKTLCADCANRRRTRCAKGAGDIKQYTCAAYLKNAALKKGQKRA